LKLISSLFWGILGNAIWAAISGGALIAAIVAVFAFAKKHPQWEERA
jgi:hypothetical protein